MSVKNLPISFLRSIVVPCLALIAVWCLPCCAADTVRVYILAGQSNMVGVTPTAGLPSGLLIPQSDAIIYTDGYVNASVGRQWLNLGPGFGFDTVYFGPELAFGRTMADSLSDTGVKVALIKWSIGGEDLYNEWRPPSSGGTTGNRYKGLFAVIDAALAALPSSYVPVIAGMLWMQGESDGTNLFWANAYDTNLTNLIADVRDTLGIPALPFVAGMIHLSLWWPFADIVRNAAANAANRDSAVGAFETQDLSLKSDSAHYLTDAMVELGKRFALTMLELSDKTENDPPFIDAGPRQISVATSYPSVLGLNGSASDDGKPGSPLAVAWEKVSGPGTATFGDSGSPVTTVTLSQPGTYHLRLSASDGAIISTDAVMISLDTVPNLALTASSRSTSYCSPKQFLAAVNDGADPSNSYDLSCGAYGNWPATGMQWVQFDWPSPTTVNRIDVYWYDDRDVFLSMPRGICMPAGCVLKYWDGTDFIPVTGASGYGVDSNRYNTTTFDEVTTASLRLEFTSKVDSLTGILEWKVYGGEPGYVKPRPAALSGAFTVSVAGSRLNITLPASAENKPVTIRIFDASGRMIVQSLRQTPAGGTFTVNLACLKASRIYCGEIRCGKEIKTAVICRVR